MTRSTPQIPALNAGEFSPRLWSRLDFRKYPYGLETAENVILLAEGAAARRSGTRYIAELKSSAVKGRLMRFRFSTTDSHILEFGDAIMRFYRHQGRIESGGSPVEIATPWAEADLPDIRGVQTADVLYLFHPDHSPRKLERSSLTSWSLSEVEWQDGPYLTQNATATTLTASAGTGSVTVTASAATGINGGDGFKSTDVGRLIRMKSGSNWAWLKITGFTSTTQVSADVEDGTAPTTGNADWRLGAWSDTTGWPQVAAFFEQRLYVAATDTQPETFWASQVADFENFRPDDAAGVIEDDDALEFTLNADDVNAIRWLSAGGDTLVIGTAGGEWIPSSQGAVLTPNDLSVRRQTTRPAANIPPVRIDNFVLFVQRALRKIREFGYTFESDAYQAPDMTRLAAHVTYGGLSEIDWAEEPHSLVYAVRSDGQLLTMTYRREEDVVGWSRHILGGSFGSGDAVVESLAVIPGADGSGQTQDSSGRDEVWIIVKRTIDGATNRYIEMFERDFEDGHDQEDAYYADSLITYDGAAATVITGLDHLEGETVKVWADGYIAPDATVSSGQITLGTAASVVQIGLGYTHKIKPLKLQGGTKAGTSLGKTKRIPGITFSLHNCATLTFGPDADTLTTVDFRDVGDAMDAAVPLFTGDKFYEFDDGWGEDPRPIIQDDAPAPFMLTSLAPEMDVKELK